MKTFNLLVVALVVVCNMNAADVLTEKLQRGLFEEEANHNLDAAIKEYQSVVSQAEEQRKVMATALFRLGECYRKLGRTNEANAQYERVVRDFSEQEQLVKLSRSLLPLHNTEVRRLPTGVSEDHASIKLLREEIALAEQQVRLTQSQMDAGRGTLDELLRVKQDVLRLKRLLPENNPPAQQKALLEEQIGIVQKLLNEVQRRVDVGRAPLGEEVPVKREMLALQRELSVVSDVATSFGATPPENSMSQAEAEELARVKTLAKNSPDLLQSSGKDGLSQLQLAARDGHYSVVEFILSHGVTANGPEHASSSPLLLAAGRGHLRIVQLLLDKGADVNAASSAGPTMFSSVSGNFIGQTALMSACENGFRSVVELLLERGADVNRASDFNTIALHYAALKGRASIAELLLKRGSKTDVISKDQTRFQDWPQFSMYGATPLHLAVERGFTALVELLLKSGASASISNYAQFTPLHLAASLPNTAICGLLLDKGADPNAEDRDGNTPLSIAIGNKRPETVALLVAKGADVNRPIVVKSHTSYPQYPLHLAILSTSREVLDVLLAAKPNLEVINRSGYTPLVQVLASQSPSVALAEDLLAAGANPNNAAVNTLPIWYCIGKGPRIVGALLRHGANPNVLGYDARTPLSSIQESINNALRSSSEPQVIADLRETEQLLRKHGANENLRRLSAIDYTRPAWTRYPEKIFFRGTNDYNRYTLFEMLAQVFGSGSAVPFPDFSRVNLERLEGTNAKPRELALNVEEMIRRGECSNDVWLEWGDRISFPELDHPLNESWPGISKEMRDLLIQCGTRRVQIVVKQETNVVKLVPNMSQPVPGAGASYGGPGAVIGGAAVPLNTTPGGARPTVPTSAIVQPQPTMTREQAEAIIENRRQALQSQNNNRLPPPTGLTPVIGNQSPIVADPPGKFEKTLLTCRLKEVVYGANVLRASSDPARVRVIRRGLNSTNEWRIDLTKVALPGESRTADSPAIQPAHDLWLRDGDVIEIPDKQ
jgi:ankyrin repeat protein